MFNVIITLLFLLELNILWIELKNKIWLNEKICHVKRCQFEFDQLRVI
jgi:hypothetical protein